MPPGAHHPDSRERHDRFGDDQRWSAPCLSRPPYRHQGEPHQRQPAQPKGRDRQHTPTARHRLRCAGPQEEQQPDGRLAQQTHQHGFWRAAAGERERQPALRHHDVEQRVFEILAC